MLRTRELCKDHKFDGDDDKIRHICDLYIAPGLRASVRGTTRKERRQQRVRSPPERPGMILYRTDGAARGQGRGGGDAVSGWGAACFGLQRPGGSRQVICEAYGFLGEGISNNIAEYQGLLAAARHAANAGHNRVCIQTDSNLVANQISCLWACRAAELRQWLARVWRAIRTVESRGGEVLVEHIYVPRIQQGGRCIGKPCCRRTPIHGMEAAELIRRRARDVITRRSC